MCPMSEPARFSTVAPAMPFHVLCATGEAVEIIHIEERGALRRLLVETLEGDRMLVQEHELAAMGLPFARDRLIPASA